MTDPLDTNVESAAVRNASTAKRVSLWFKKTGEALYRELGNIISPKLAMDIQELEHFSNRRGQRTRDRIEIGQIKGNLAFSVDECNKRNLQNCFGGSEEAAADSVDVMEGGIFENLGGGELIDLLGMGDINDPLVESTNEEATKTTYESDPLSTDSTDDTAGGDFTNTTDPLTILAATYPAVAAKGVGGLIKVEDEIMRITEVGTDVTLARAQLGTVAASHADGTSIYTSAGSKTYVADLTNGKVYILTDGPAADPDDVPEFHIQWSKTVTTEKFQVFDGTPIRGSAQLQVLTPKGLRAVITMPSVTLKNDGDLTFGTGESWIEFPMQMEVLADGTGSIGSMHVIDADQTV